MAQTLKVPCKYISVLSRKYELKDAEQSILLLLDVFGSPVNLFYFWQPSATILMSDSSVFVDIGFSLGIGPTSIYITCIFNISIVF
jgi:hypothetical protein